MRRPGRRPGRPVRQATVEAYRLEYDLVGLPGAAAAPGHSHHVMLCLTGPDGRAIEDAKVVYRVSGPGEPRPKVTAFYSRGRRVSRAGSRDRSSGSEAMEDGYGADVTLGDRAGYRVATTVAAGAVTLRDEFAYEVR